MPLPPKVDVHHHVVPPEIAGADYGIKTPFLPRWDISSDKSFNSSINVGFSVLSVSTPGVSHFTDPAEAAKAARSMNKYCARLRDDNPRSYGFFATVPSLEYRDLVLEEIRYAFDELQADGVTLFSRYGKGDGYLGHEDFVPIWEELNKRNAVIFMHPTTNKNPYAFNDKIIMPAFDWPHETGRTAIDMIFNKRLLQFPNVKIILSHAGGTLPLLAKRSTLMSRPEYGAVLSSDEIMSQAKSFYFDTALSGSPEVLPLILEFAKEGHVLFGSDYPHATPSFSQEFAKYIDEYPMGEQTRKLVYHGAAEKLFPRLKGMFDK